MSHYTADDLAAIKTAIMKLVTGQTRVSVQFSSAAGSRTRTFKSADLSELRTLESEISRGLSGQSRTVLTRSRKGL